MRRIHKRRLDLNIDSRKMRNTRGLAGDKTVQKRQWHQRGGHGAINKIPKMQWTESELCSWYGSEIKERCSGCKNTIH